ncbi:MAG: methionine--tRNA ligase [Nitrospinae bacterium]|nr:methionine--tRNA ligase [Nitrospinota bacterium]
MSSLPKTIVVTAALPYANGSIHLGHLVEYIQTDIFVRFQKMKGVDCRFFCADDTHGAPIMIRAKNEGTTPEAVIERYYKEHTADFDTFHIRFDNYDSTNSPTNRELAEGIFNSLKAAGAIVTRDVEQTYCEHDKMFLPDRFVRGVCPKCSAPDQYGDSCDVCGAHYDTTDLKEPRCSLCGAAPTRRSSAHYFFRVADYMESLKKFMEGDALQPEVKNFLATWLKEGLKEWDISRDGPYFGFNIPGEADKYFYVWLDAPIGYLSSAKNWAAREGKSFEQMWKNGDSEIHHFIGKDIVYFHTLFWIPMLTGSGYRLPDRIHVHGFLTINGEKMSKSRGTFINARDFADHINPELLRYYYATKLKNSVDDLDINFQDFVFRVNAELVNKIANLGSRTITILNKNAALENRLGKIAASESGMMDEITGAAERIKGHYEACDFALAVKEMTAMADVANVFIDRAAPWDIKDDVERLREVLTAGINAFAIITAYLKPVAPVFAEKVERILKVEPFNWNDTARTLENHVIGQFERLMDRVDMKAVEKVLEKAKQKGEAAKPAPAAHGHLTKHGEDATPAAPPARPEEKPRIEYDDFAKVELRTAKVLAAEKLPKADKLLKLTMDVGGEQRTIVAGIAKAYTPEEMVGKTVVIVANLKPRKLMGVESNGMVLAVNDGETLTLVSPSKEVKSGLRVS